MTRQTKQNSENQSGIKHRTAYRRRARDHEIEAMLLIGKRNMDTIWAINRLSIDCIHKCAERQVAIWDRCVAHHINLLEIFSQRAGYDSQPSQFVPTVVDTIEACLGQMRKLSEVIADTNQEAMELINHRSCACIREVEEIAQRSIDELSDKHRTKFPAQE